MSSSSYQDSRKVRVKRFDPQAIKSNRVILITGKRGSGKTTLVKDLIYKMRGQFDVGIGIGGTVASVEMLEGFLPKSMVHFVSDFDKVDLIERLVEKAKVTREHGRQRRFLLIMDDFAYRKDLLRHPIFREIFMNGRNFNMTLMLSAQYIMDLSSDLRSQIDYVFTFKETIPANRKRLFEYFYGMCNTLRDFEQLLSEFTKNYECLVMDNTSNSGEMEDQLFYYKAPFDTPDFTIGKRIYWAMDMMCNKKSAAGLVNGGFGGPATSSSSYYKKLAGTDAQGPLTAAQRAAAAGAAGKTPSTRLQITRGH